MKDNISLSTCSYIQECEKVGVLMSIKSMRLEQTVQVYLSFTNSKSEKT